MDDAEAPEPVELVADGVGVVPDDVVPDDVLPGNGEVVGELIVVELVSVRGLVEVGEGETALVLIKFNEYLPEARECTE